jgi:hypothetical protein
VSSNNSILYENLEQKVADRYRGNSASKKYYRTQRHNQKSYCLIFCRGTAIELKRTGTAQPGVFEDVTVLSPISLIISKVVNSDSRCAAEALGFYFGAFDTSYHGTTSKGSKPLGQLYVWGGLLRTTKRIPKRP